jgi:hypothetical protein
MNFTNYDYVISRILVTIMYRQVSDVFGQA